MEDKKKKCSKIEHKDIDAISYCQECKIYICNKCSNFHQELFNNHQINILDNNQEIFIDICKEKNHPLKLEFYCKNHNKVVPLVLPKWKQKDMDNIRIAIFVLLKI